VVDDPIRAGRVAEGSEGFLTTNAKDGEAGPASPKSFPDRTVHAHPPGPFRAGREYSIGSDPADEIPFSGTQGAQRAYPRKREDP